MTAVDTPVAVPVSAPSSETRHDSARLWFRYYGGVPAKKASVDSRAAADQAQQLAAASQSQSATVHAELNERTRKLQQELGWSEGASDLLMQSIPILDLDRGRDFTTSDTGEISPRLLAAEAARHVRRRSA